MVEQSDYNREGLQSLLSSLSDELSNDQMEYLLSHFGDLSPYMDDIRAVLPDPDMFYGCLSDDDDTKKEELYIKCYFPGGNLKASYELADLLRASYSDNPFVWHFFVDQHLPVLPAADREDMLDRFSELELDMDCADFAFFAQHSEPKHTEPIQDLVCRIYPQTAREILDLEELTKLVERKFHTWRRYDAASRAHFARYALLYIIRYLGLHTDKEVCSYYHIAEADLPNLNKEAHQLYKKNIRFRNTVNELIDGIEELLDAV